jgi:hypothetical protein
MYNEIEISRSLLEHEYKTMKVKDILEKYGLCCQSFYNLLDQLDIKRKRERLGDRKPNVKIVIKD